MNTSPGVADTLSFEEVSGHLLTFDRVQHDRFNL